MSDVEPRRVGILGSGNIFGRYVEGLAQVPEVRIVRVGDVDIPRARKAAADHGIPSWGDAAALYGDDSVEVVINLTPPDQHAATTITALESGKHAYVEKPLATTLEDGRAVVDVARASGRMLGLAPDTFLGSAGQTARRAIDRGLIGEPIGSTAFVRHSRAEAWHPDPRFLFREGGGPVLDMGPYYIASLVHCLGPVTTVAAASRIGASLRRVTAPDRVVDSIEVTVATHASAVMTFASGVIATVMMSFDVWDTELPRIEIYGSDATLSLPNPNTFDGDVRIRRHDDDAWEILPPAVELFGAIGTADQLRRGLGVRDLVGALSGGTLRTNPDFALHTLEVLTSIRASSTEPAVARLTTTCVRPDPLYRH